MKFATCDQRLNERAQYCFDKLKGKVHEPFPAVFPTHSELAGFYRFINNTRVNEQDLLSSIKKDAIYKANDNTALTLCIHDTTQYDFCSLELPEKMKFFSHTSLLVNFKENPEVYGLVAIENWRATSNIPNEERWHKSAAEVQKHLNNEIIYIRSDRNSS